MAKVTVAIVGAGPSGFYAAQSLVASDEVERIDIYDQLPTPHGLVRYGIAPDHEKTKRIAKVFERTADHEKVNFFGNVTLGTDVSLDKLQQAYSAVILATGASLDRELNVHGNAYEEIIPATNFVNWYNSHPHYSGLKFDLDFQSAIILGNGNVTLDLCRILAKDKASLTTTDIADYTINGLAENARNRIYIVGRRGPAQAKFSAPELKELADLNGWSIWVDPKDLELNAASVEELQSPSGGNIRSNLDFLGQHASESDPDPNVPTIVFKFFREPMEFLKQGGSISAKFAVTKLAGEAGTQSVERAGRIETLSADRIFKSIGNRAGAIEGVPHDPVRGKIPNLDGQVVGSNQVPVSGLYVVGWAKRGPSGTVGTNRVCADETVKQLLEDLRKGKLQRPALDPVDVLDCFERATDLAHWRRIDAHELEEGARTNRPRVKLQTIREMIELGAS